MDANSIVVILLLSLILGAVVGLEREINEKKILGHDSKKPQVVLGLRTFSLITLLGSIAGLLFSHYQAMSLLISCSVFLFFIVFYVIDTLQTKDTGITTELALVFSYLIGYLLGIEIFPMHIIIALAVVLILILSKKRRIKDVVEDIQMNELNAFIAYAIIALVILPFLPNTPVSLSDFKGLENILQTFGLQVQKVGDIELFNPFKLWLIVALITGIDIIGYVLERTIGKKKGWLLASVVGGFVSSTATTQSLAQQSKNSKRINHLLAAALAANLVSFLQIGILLSPINAAFVAKLLPTFLAIVLITGGATIYFLRIKETVPDDIVTTEKDYIDKGIFELGPALRFAGLYLVISMFSKIALEFFGSGAFLLTTALGALAGLDAVMINTAQLAGNRIDFTLAILAFIIANAVNLSGKVFYSFLQGKREFAVKFAVSMGAAIAASCIGLLFI